MIKKDIHHYSAEFRLSRIEKFLRLHHFRVLICVRINKAVELDTSAYLRRKSAELRTPHTVADEVSEHQFRLRISKVEMGEVIHVRQRYVTAAPCLRPNHVKT